MIDNILILIAMFWHVAVLMLIPTIAVALCFRFYEQLKEKFK